MAADAEAALVEAGADNVAVVRAPLAEGAAKHGPYDVIVLEAAVEQVPEALLSQLKDGGRIAGIFSEGPLGVCRIGYGSGGRVSWRDVFHASAPVLPGFARQADFVL